MNKKKDTITVEFSRKALMKLCPLTDWCKTCDKSDWQLLDCHMNEVSYKIKEKKKRNKGE